MNKICAPLKYTPPKFFYIVAFTKIIKWVYKKNVIKKVNVLIQTQIQINKNMIAFYNKL